MQGNFGLKLQNIQKLPCIDARFHCNANEHYGNCKLKAATILPLFQDNSHSSVLFAVRFSGFPGTFLHSALSVVLLSHITCVKAICFFHCLSGKLARFLKGAKMGIQSVEVFEEKEVRF